MSMIGMLLRVEKEKLNEILEDSSILEDILSADDNDALIDIDKTWDGLFYLITGYPVMEYENAKAPLSWFFFSGQLVDEEQDLGYGPGHYITPDQVKLLQTNLSEISTEQFIQRFDGEKMNSLDIYPKIWDQEDAREYLLDHLTLIQSFYESAAREGNAVITFIS